MATACWLTSATLPPVTGAYRLALRDNSNATASRNTAAANCRSATVGRPLPVAAHHAVTAAANMQLPSPGTRTTFHCCGVNVRWLGVVTIVLYDDLLMGAGWLGAPRASRWLGAPRASRWLGAPRASRWLGAPRAGRVLGAPRARGVLGASGRVRPRNRVGERGC